MDSANNMTGDSVPVSLFQFESVYSVALVLSDPGSHYCRIRQLQKGSLCTVSRKYYSV